VAPRVFATGVFDLSVVNEQDSGLRDASGQRILGQPVLVTMRIDGLPTFQEEVWFSKAAPFGLLGQTSVFERFSARFHNHERGKRGRRFALSIPVLPP
jgi:hypothetical protein